jgi:hypothetical protein
VNLKKNLEENGIDPERIPIIIQFNKRDLEDIRSDEELTSIASRSRETIYKAIATRGYGVMQTFTGLISETWAKLEGEHGLEEKFGISPLRFMSEIESQLKHDARRMER